MCAQYSIQVTNTSVVSENSEYVQMLAFRFYTGEVLWIETLSFRNVKKKSTFRLVVLMVSKGEFETWGLSRAWFTLQLFHFHSLDI